MNSKSEVQAKPIFQNNQLNHTKPSWPGASDRHLQALVREYAGCQCQVPPYDRHESWGVAFTNPLKIHMEHPGIWSVTWWNDHCLVNELKLCTSFCHLHVLEQNTKYPESHQLIFLRKFTLETSCPVAGKESICSFHVHQINIVHQPGQRVQLPPLKPPMFLIQVA